jgi:penicillin-insensitive murein endopeptidase
MWVSWLIGLFAIGTAGAILRPDAHGDRAQVRTVEVAAAEVPAADFSPTADETAEIYDPSLFRHSISCGAANFGRLFKAAELPLDGIGYTVPSPWSKREHNFGTDELVGLIQRVAAEVADLYPGAVLGVADLTGSHGGKTRSHRSHQSGRDVDLMYYALNRDGDPFEPDHAFPWYEEDGRAVVSTAPREYRIKERYFDLKRNWAMVELLLTDDHATVDRIFVSDQIEAWLLAYARKIDVDRRIVERAQYVLMRPSNSSPHNDHMHVRIKCSIDDIAIGYCTDYLAPRDTYGEIPCPAARPMVVLPD